MKKLEDINLEHKKVIIRVDYNVPLNENLEITDDNRIVESLKTLNYCLEHKAKVILLSHLGKVKTEEDKKKKSLRVVALRLSELLGKEVKFIPATRGKEVDDAVNNMQDSDVILLENTRFEDIDGKKESGNDPELAKYWASLGDVFINDAFGTCHRSHASNVGIASNMQEVCLGFLVRKELDNLLPIIDKPERPFTVILGGAKISDKIATVQNLIKKADYILIGGAMAYTFLKGKGIETGKSLIDEESLDFAKDVLKTTDKIILPIDHIVSTSTENSNYQIKNTLESDDIGLDIGPKTRELFKSYLLKSKTIFWNGPMGYYEKEVYQEGTKELCEFISNLDATSIVGGGDTASAIINMGFKDKFTHVSTGGGASLELLEGKGLPGINI